ncbi:MAG: hypothetical protein WB646_20585, partial [Steroidobacteraceae bacterium]
MNSYFRYPLIMLSALFIVRFGPAAAATDPGDLGPPRGSPIEEALVAPPNVPAAIHRDHPARVIVRLETHEVIK